MNGYLTNRSHTAEAFSNHRVIQWTSIDIDPFYTTVRFTSDSSTLLTPLVDLGGATLALETKAVHGDCESEGVACGMRHGMDKRDHGA